MLIPIKESLSRYKNKHSHPLVSARDYFQDPSQRPKSTDAQVPYMKECSKWVQLSLFIHLSSLWGINQLQIDPWLVESLDVKATYVKPRDMESQPYINAEWFFSANIIVFDTLKDYSNFCFPPWWNNKDWIYPTSWHKKKIKETMVFREWTIERTSRKSIKITGRMNVYENHGTLLEKGGHSQKPRCLH